MTTRGTLQLTLGARARTSQGPVIVDTSNHWANGFYQCRIVDTGLAAWYVPDLARSPSQYFAVTPWVQVYSGATGQWYWYGLDGWNASHYWGWFLAESYGTYQFHYGTDYTPVTQSLPYYWNVNLPAGYQLSARGLVEVWVWNGRDYEHSWWYMPTQGDWCYTP